MKHFKGFAAIMAVWAVLLLAPAAQAQSPGTDGLYAVRIEGMKAADRDALQGQLRQRADLHLVYACVPAGILVFAAQGAADREATKERATPLLRSRMAGARITELEHGLAEAEAACAQLRDR